MHTKALPRLIIAGLSGGSGKTVLSLGLIRSLARQGLRITPCKKGPDYIDAAWLSLAAGKAGSPGKQNVCAPAFWNDCPPPVNLDPFFLEPSRLRDQLVHRHGNNDIAIIEGNRGLFDGGDVEGRCSTAALSRTLESPVVLVVNATKMTRTAAAIIAGLQAFEDFWFAGVVFNQVGTARQADILRAAVEKYTSIPVLGMLPRLADNPMPERHMGLAGGHSLDAATDSVLERLADHVEANCDVEKLVAIAQSTKKLTSIQPFWAKTPPMAAHAVSRPKIAVAYDAALWFYYQENLEALELAGAELIPVSLAGARSIPWDDMDGLYMGGGFPETMEKQLARSSHVAVLAGLAKKGMPIYAECGGLMVLCRGLYDNLQGQATSTWGDVLPLRVVQHKRPQGLGYVHGTVAETTPFFSKGTMVRGHEFHYSSCETLNGEAVFNDSGHIAPAVATVLNGPVFRLDKGIGMGKDATAQGMDGVHAHGVQASYLHIFAPAVPEWAHNFVQAARAFRQGI